MVGFLVLVAIVGAIVGIQLKKNSSPPTTSTSTSLSPIDSSERPPFNLKKIEPEERKNPEGVSLIGVAELPPDQGEVAYIVRVIDGDTVEIRYKNANERARLVGIDTPETNHPTKGVECFGPEAKKFMSTTLPPGTEVRITWNHLGDRRDKYNRLLVYLWVQLDEDPNFELLNAVLVLYGYARVYPFFAFDRYKEFRALEMEARIFHRGLWGACNFVPYY